MNLLVAMKVFDRTCALGSLSAAARDLNMSTTAVSRLIKELELRPAGDCGCIEFAGEMDRWGVDGCRQRRAEIIDRLKSKLPEVTWRQRWGAGWQLLTKHAPWFRVRDPFGSIVDEAIRRAVVSGQSSVVSGRFMQA